jgi:hypothetical protein
VTIIAALLMGLAGHCMLRLLVRRVPLRAYGLLATAGLSVLLGAAVIGLLTTYVAVLGLPTRVWAVVGPIVIALAVFGILPPRVFAALHLPPEDSQPATREMGLADGVVGGAIVGLGAVLLTGSSKLVVFSNDEWAIWAIRGRTLSLAGHLDPAVFQGSVAQYQHLDYPLLVPSLVAWGDGIAGHPDDSGAHVLVILLTLGMLAVVGWAANRLAGPYAGVCSVLLIAGTPRLLAPYGLRVFADVPLAAFAVALLLVLAMWIVHGNGRMLAVGAALAVGTAAVKDEGVVFALAGLLAALVVPAQVSAPSPARAVRSGDNDRLDAAMARMDARAWHRVRPDQRTDIDPAPSAPGCRLLRAGRPADRALLAGLRLVGHRRRCACCCPRRDRAAPAPPHRVFVPSLAHRRRRHVGAVRDLGRSVPECRADPGRVAWALRIVGDPGADGAVDHRLTGDATSRRQPRAQADAPYPARKPAPAVANARRRPSRHGGNGVRPAARQAASESTE